VKEYIGYYGGYIYDESPARRLGPGYITPVTRCADKCGRGFRNVSVDVDAGVCWECYREQFEGEPLIVT